MRLLNEPRRIARQFIAFDTCQREGITGIVNQRAYQCVDTFTNQASIGAEYEHDRLCWIGLGDETVDVGGLNGGHGAPTKTPTPSPIQPTSRPPIVPSFFFSP